MVQLLPIPQEEAITTLIPVSNSATTRPGDAYPRWLHQAHLLPAFGNIRSNGLIAINLEEGDALTWVRLAVPGDGV